MNTNFIYNFFRCGLIGWGFECFFTGICSLLRGDSKLVCTSSLWMFPIYGLAACIVPLNKLIGTYPWFIRGLLYMIGIFLVEYLTGRLLQTFYACPWDYSHAKYNLSGVIRLDYAPFWFLVGLIYEKLLIFQW